MKRYDFMFLEGKNYKTVEIGDQIWMAENLNSQINDSKCYNNDYSYCNIYGRLYTMEGAYNACPSGWRLPSKEEWQKLLDFAGGMETAGEKLKATSDWNDGNGENTYGFAALPGGYQAPNTPNCTNMGILGIWWSSSPSESNEFYSLSISEEKGIQFNSLFIGHRLSIRCIKDN
jgi:uncharacterized protein (TIGR02145 family)